MNNVMHSFFSTVYVDLYIYMYIVHTYNILLPLFVAWSDFLMYSDSNPLLPSHRWLGMCPHHIRPFIRGCCVSCPLIIVLGVGNLNFVHAHIRGLLSMYSHVHVHVHGHISVHMHGSVYCLSQSLMYMARVTCVYTVENWLSCSMWALQNALSKAYADVTCYV